VGLNFRDHVKQEFFGENLDEYIVFGGILDHMDEWRSYTPLRLYAYVQKEILHRLNP
jgi:hypothetical protein